MSVVDWLVVAVAGVAGFFLNEYLRNTLQRRGHDQLSAGVAVLASASFFALIVFGYIILAR